MNPEFICLLWRQIALFVFHRYYRSPCKAVAALPRSTRLARVLACSASPLLSPVCVDSLRSSRRCCRHTACSVLPPTPVRIPTRLSCVWRRHVPRHSMAARGQDIRQGGQQTGDGETQGGPGAGRLTIMPGAASPSLSSHADGVSCVPVGRSPRILSR